MQVDKINTSVSYTSRNCPIKPFSIKTPKGILYCSEIDYDKKFDKSYYKKIAKFFIDIFANTSSHPFWEKCRKPNLNFLIYRIYLRDTVSGYRMALKDPDTTMLFARDKEGRIKAGIFAKSLDTEAHVKEPRTLYIDSLAVDKEYRKSNVGKKLLQKVLNSSKHSFEDVFLVAYKESAPFYKKIGFKNTKNAQSESLDKLIKERLDYPDYAEFLEKSLNNTSGKKWYERADEYMGY